MGDVIRIDLGMSIFEAEVIAQSATAVGLQVQLLRNADAEMGGAFALGGCALLARADEEAEVRRLLAESGY